ncbi:efflux RND transporter periplasmic adaptor subunit [Altericroceibacterium endophyticum]|uniref:Efflux RND transporter periplasmic adaptor subunit n=1 Tax=Altericroceibacterium endophyticum TaxID=1808508 RepID=A0A6I4T8Y2_9SPHN|nr:efflux RND transporter periplasmic adaptor subunit [Altericroceibacterium endophyticum]MXO66320.1 efflux RND transporter periplasmic adaptor subunit [Altericroceibacterium endophyticum]
MRSPFMILALSLVLASCGGEQQAPEQQALPVEVIVVSPEKVPNVVELPARVEPVRVAEVRARVTGIVQKRLYEEGTDVRKGQALFRIDPSELRATYAQTEAALQRAKATAANARAVVNRYKPLVDKNAISGQEYDAAVAAAREAEANVSQIKAELRSASLQLGYTTVTAPISGRASRAQVTEGALVSQSEGTLMTRIEQMSPVYVRFSQSATELMAVRGAIADGDLSLDDNEPVEVRLSFPDGTEYPLPGVIDFLDFSVEESTGTVQLRAEFPNPSGMLLPGEFVRAKVYAGIRNDGISLPQRVVTVTDNGGTVFVVDGKGQVAARPVELGTMNNGNWIINGGLKNGDRVISNNLQKLRPGMPVKPVAPKNKKTSAQSGEKAPAPKKSAAGQER